MNTSTKRLILIVAAVLVVAAAGYAIWMSMDQKASVPLTLYRNGLYDYTFAYPPEYRLIEQTSNNVVLSKKDGAGMRDVAAVTSIRSAEAAQYSSFEAFVVEQARSFCAADIPGTTITCPRVETQEAFMASTGVEGVMFYLVQESKVGSVADVETGRKGPFYAFDISAANPGAQFTALIVRPPSLVVAENIDPEFIRSIANTVQIQTPEAEAPAPAPAQ